MLEVELGVTVNVRDGMIYQHLSTRRFERYCLLFSRHWHLRTSPRSEFEQAFATIGSITRASLQCGALLHGACNR